MDADAVLALRAALPAYLAEFAPCMGKRSNHSHLEIYVAGQLGPLQRKSVEPIALAAGTPPRTLQEFLEMFKWDHRGPARPPPTPGGASARARRGHRHLRRG